MNKLLLPMLCLGMGASLATYAQEASPVAANVPEGSFYCFPPGAPVNKIAGSSDMKRVRRVDKLGNSKWDNSDGHDLREIVTEGSPEILVILVEFQDQKFALNIGDPKERITEMLNGDNYTFQGAEGSAREFYRYTSAGKFTPKFNVVGPVVCSKNEVEYVTPSEKDYLPGSTTQECYPASRMIEEAVKLVDDEIDFSKYDMDGDGFVDFVYVFFAGRGATTGGNSRTTIWPHAFTLTSGIGAPVELDGVKINRYCCSAETGSNGKLSGIGTFCHEFGHVLGLPDLYDTANNGQVSKCFTPGTYDCMDGGNYNNSEHTPATFSIYEQYALEWTKPVEITGSANITMIPLAARPFGYKVNTNRAKTEYFMLENRGPIANDYYLEGHGMLAWHIDFNLDAWTRNVPNNLADHQRIDIEEADASPDISSRAGDVFPGTAGVHEFQSFGRPGFCDWDYEGTGYEITEIIRHADGTISFKVTADEGNEMTEARIGTPVAEVAATSATTATLKWQPVDNADSYMVSVYDPSLFDGNLLKDYVEGYCFKSVDDATTTEITGLEPGKHYAAFVYALNEYNASRTPMSLEFTTISGNGIEAATNVYAHSDDNVVTLSWDAVEEADRYELTVALPIPAESTSSVEENFDQKSIPEGWKTDCRYYDNAQYSGKAAPSLRFMASGNHLTTKMFDEQISSISFWAAAHYNDPCQIHIYGSDAKGNCKMIKSMENISKQGTVYEIAFPEGIHQAKVVFFNLTSGQTIHLDDMTVNLTTGSTDYAPLAANAAEINIDGTKAIVKGLAADTEYAAYVTPYKGETAGTRSNVLLFTPSKALSGVDGIAIDSELDLTVENGTIICNDPETAFSVYSIDGMLLARDVRGSFTLPQRGIYIVRAAGKSAKVNW